MNTETKELLTLAARAMGGEYLYAPSVGIWMLVLPTGVKRPWSPLTSGDDLVEMECQQEVWINWEGNHLTAFVNDEHGDIYTEYFIDHNNRRAARAMAVLRVVAEVGRRMESGK